MCVVCVYLLFHAMVTIYLGFLLLKLYSQLFDTSSLTLKCIKIMIVRMVIIIS